MKTLKALMLTVLVAALVFPPTVISYDYYQLPGIKDYKKKMRICSVEALTISVYMF